MFIRRCLPVALAAAIMFSLAVGHTSLEAQSSMLVIASGLDNPRGLSFGPDGALYVAESGRGGSSTLCLPDVAPPFPPIRCLGPSGAITRISGVNQHRRVVTNLPSVAVPPGNDASGPNDVEFGFGSMWITLGLIGDPATRAALEAAGVRPGYLVRASMNGDWSYQLDLAGYEATANPDGRVPDSNPFKLLLQANRAVFADAGGNALNQIGTDLRISTLAVFPQKTVTGGPVPVTDPVPTSVAAGPDGALYVGELTGFPFTPGAANLYRVPASGGTPEAIASNFTMIIDVAADDDGTVYVLEHDIDGLLGPSNLGRLSRLRADGSRTVVASEGLVKPGGVTVGPDGALYVTTHANSPATGTVVRVVAP